MNVIAVNEVTLFCVRASAYRESVTPFRRWVHGCSYKFPRSLPGRCVRDSPISARLTVARKLIPATCSRHFDAWVCDPHIPHSYFKLLPLFIHEVLFRFQILSHSVFTISWNKVCMCLCFVLSYSCQIIWVSNNNAERMRERGNG